MELFNLIPDNSEAWQIRGRFLFYKKLELIPICIIIDETPYIILDGRIHKAVLKLTQHLIKLNVEFYFTTPLISNPSGVHNFNKEVVENYIWNYANKFFFHGFKKLDYDIIRNLVKWTEKEDCFHLVKEVYENVKKNVQSSFYDYYGNKEIFQYDKEIRDAFDGLYRDIQISKIL